MGFSLCWIAVRGLGREMILHRLGLRPNGEREEVPEARYSGGQLPSGWYVVVSNNDFKLIEDDRVKSDLSHLGEAIICFVEEHVMISGAAGWKGGQCNWAVRHEAEEGLEHLVEEGNLPDCYASIRNDLLESLKEDPEGCDYVFDAPIALAAALTGYRHDEMIDTDGADFYEVLE